MIKRKINLRENEKWTLNEIHQLKNLKLKKMTWNEIGKFLNRSQEAVRKKYGNIKPKEYVHLSRRWTEDEIEQLKDMKANRMSWSEIANNLKRSYDSVEKKFRVVKEWIN